MTPTWQIPLEHPPQVVEIARHAHGFVQSDRYRLDDLWSLHLYCYDAILRVNGQEIPIRPGTLGLTPPGTLLESRYFGISVHIFAHFRLPDGPTQPVAALTHVGSSFELLFDELFEASKRFCCEPGWAAARVWNALWKAASLTNAEPMEKPPLHPSVQIATDLIERNLNGPISVKELAQRAGLAPDYLTRLFQHAYGETIVGYIRRRRMERASNLLQRSTLPIKMVASSVGYPDLQRFNKAVRAEFGMGPREWRSQGLSRS